MSPKICVGFLALPFFLCNAYAANASTINSPIIKQTVSGELTIAKNTNYHLPPIQLEGRDGKTRECLRFGTCDN